MFDIDEKTIKRFWAKVDRRNDGDCWLWTASKDHHGYGQLAIRFGCDVWKPRRASQVSWKIHFGPIPEGKNVCHRCDNPLCVNPSHLFLGLQIENVRDMRAKGRGVSPTGTGNGKSKLNPESVRQIHLDADSGMTHGEIAAKFGVTKSCVWSIFAGETWSHVSLEGLGLKGTRRVKPWLRKDSTC